MIHDEHADLDVAYASKRRMIMVMLMVVEVLHGMPKINLDVFLFIWFVLLFGCVFHFFGPCSRWIRNLGLRRLDRFGALTGWIWDWGFPLLSLPFVVVVVGLGSALRGYP